MTTCLIEIILAKNKNGSPGSIKLLRDENFTNFTCLNEDIIFEKKLEEMTTKNPNIKTLIDRLSLINTNY